MIQLPALLSTQTPISPTPDALPDSTPQASNNEVEKLGQISPELKAGDEQAMKCLKGLGCLTEEGMAAAEDFDLPDNEMMSAASSRSAASEFEDDVLDAVSERSLASSFCSELSQEAALVPVLAPATSPPKAFTEEY